MGTNIANKKIIVILLMSLLVRIAFFILNEEFEIYLLIGSINQSVVNLLLNILIIILISMLLNHKFHGWKKYLLNFFAVILAFIFITIYAFNCDDTYYFYFKAPDGTNTLVVEEGSFLLAGWSNFYERKSTFFIKDLKEQINTDDGYRPFSDGHYTLDWIDDTTIDLRYDFGTGDIEEKEIRITLK